MREHVFKLHNMLKEHPELLSDVNYYEMSRVDQMKTWWSRFRTLMGSEKFHHFITGFTRDRMMQRVGWVYLFPGVPPLLLHMLMFCDCLTRLTSEEQKAHYCPRLSI